MTTPPESAYYKISADVMAEMVKLDQEQRAEVARLRDRLALAEQALVDAGLREDRLRAVVTAVRELMPFMPGPQASHIPLANVRHALQRLDETATGAG